MSARVLTWLLHTLAGSIPVEQGSASVSAFRAPQIIVQLTVPLAHPGVATLDPYSRRTVYFEAVTSNYRAGTLADFDARNPPGPLSGVKWSDYASTPVVLDGTTTPLEQRVQWELTVTDVQENETAGTATVTLTSLDQWLLEVVNMAVPWRPVPEPLNGGVQAFQTGMRQMCQRLGIPLRPRLLGVYVSVDDEPWQRGQTAWSWLDARRVSAGGWRLVIDPILLTFELVPATLTAGTVNREGATTITSQRTRDDLGEGVNRYADAVGVEFRDPSGVLPDAFQYASNGPWGFARRPIVLQRDYSLVQAAASNDIPRHILARSANRRRLTTQTVPLDPQAMPLTDLTRHPQAQSIEQIVFAYPSGDVTTTLMEGA